MLQSLASLEAWLEAVELSIRQASLAGDPESVSVAEQESCQLEQELEARGLELQNLRQEVDHLSKQRHLHTQLLPARLKDVEKKYVLPVQDGQMFLTLVQMYKHQYLFQVQQCADGSDPTELGAEGHADAHRVPGEGGA